MSRKWVVYACLVFAGYTAGGASATDGAEWSVVTSTNVFYSPLQLPGLPPFNTSWSLGRVLLNDGEVGADAYFELSRNGATELWHWGKSGLEPYAVVNATGAPGPGRVGSEAGHVFRAIQTRGADSGTDGRRVFFALAGPPVPASTTFATYGLWINVGEVNREIARGRLYQPGQIHEPLDPADPGYRFASGQDMVKRAWVTPDNSTVFVADVVPVGAGGTGTRAVIRNTEASGNQVCALSGSGFLFSDSDVFAGVSNDVFVKTNFSYSDAVYRVCDGAPVELVREGVSGALGPQVESATARFSNIGANVHPDGVGGFYFEATVSDSTPGAWTGRGIFRHVAGTNVAIARTGLYGANSSGYHGRPFNDLSIYQFDMSAAGSELVFKAGVPPESGAGSIKGFWRVGAGGRPEPIAIEGTTEPAYSPYPGSAWELTISRVGIFKGGDVVLWGEAYPDEHYSLWRLRRGQRPVRILDRDDPIQVPVAGGWAQPLIVTASIPSYFPNDASDGWFNRNGFALVNTHLQGFGDLFIAAQVADVDYIFANGVDGW